MEFVIEDQLDKTSGGWSWFSKYLQSWVICSYYTTRAVRGPITKINQSKCSIAGPIFSKYRTGHCTEWSRTWAFAVIAFSSRVINQALINQSCSGPYWENIGPRSSLYGPRCPRSALSRPRADILPVRPSRLVNKIYIQCSFMQKYLKQIFRDAADSKRVVVVNFWCKLKLMYVQWGFTREIVSK